MALTGFDPDLVAGSINRVKSAYDNLIQAIGGDMQSQFVEGMQDKWACKQAQGFFNDKFKPAVDGLITSSNEIFQSVVDTMNSAAQSWATETETPYSPISFTVNSKTIDTGSILENIGGTRGIDKENANSVVAKLATIEQSANTALIDAKNAVNNCGFVGGDQESNLINSLGIIKSNLGSAINDITSSVKSAIESTVTQYGDLQGKVEEAFTAQG